MNSSLPMVDIIALILDEKAAGASSRMREIGSYVPILYVNGGFTLPAPANHMLVSWHIFVHLFLLSIDSLHARTHSSSLSSNLWDPALFPSKSFLGHIPTEQTSWWHSLTEAPARTTRLLRQFTWTIRVHPRMQYSVRAGTGPGATSSARLRTRYAIATQAIDGASSSYNFLPMHCTHNCTSLDSRETNAPHMLACTLEDVLSIECRLLAVESPQKVCEDRSSYSIFRTFWWKRSIIPRLAMKRFRNMSTLWCTSL